MNGVICEGPRSMIELSASPYAGVGTANGSTVFIVDDDRDVRNSIALLVRSIGLHSKTYSSANEFTSDYDPQCPGCLVLDVRMPGMSGLELQNQMNGRGGHLPIIMLTGHGEISMATQAMRAGAWDFLQKPYSPQVLLERISEALKFDCGQCEKRSAQSQIKARIALLTGREHEVMLHLAQGKSTKRIARELGISPKTVDNHRIKILEKLKLQNTVQLANLIAGTSE
jgi:two-component system response regulator FixJ